MLRESKKSVPLECLYDDISINNFFSLEYNFKCVKKIADTGCNLEDLLEVMDNKDRWRERERESGKPILAARLDDDEV